jgi:hypothetical protein
MAHSANFALTAFSRKLAPSAISTRNISCASWLGINGQVADVQRVWEIVR